MRMQRVRLDQHALMIQLAKEVLELRVLPALAVGVAALSDGQAERP